NQNVVVRFHDTGIGIKPEDKKHIFEPFFTTKPEVKGTGLGLSISYGIIKEHGGKITVNSAPEKGTTFSVTLPIEGGNNAAKKDTVG
ncbi:HAMP domain-containing sensor histidine kinase, partial [Desulfococcaceae bacterium HSG9]|nr:HAMP domain-containing sensor histidine kinase [Desulfococcaceae bacterium HSG9]